MHIDPVVVLPVYKKVEDFSLTYIGFIVYCVTFGLLIHIRYYFLQVQIRQALADVIGLAKQRSAG